MKTLDYYISNNLYIIILILSAMILLLTVLVIINALRINKWKNKYYQFMNAKEDFNIEEVLQNNIKNIKELKDVLKNQRVIIGDLDKHVKQSIEKTAIVKYNAFDNMGGQLSFVLALLNQNDSGLLLNGMHSREGCYIYIKEVVDGKSEKTLSDEEKKALDDAMNSIVK